MGQTAGTLPLKRFVNDPREVVADALEGYLWTHPDVQLLEGYPEVKVLVNASWQRDAGRVAIVSGGGSGHEPADAGMIGDGFLTATVCGEIFASPSAFSVARALEAVTGPAGALVVIRSNAGTRLNFLSAVKEVKSRLQLRVKMVCVADDVATSIKSGNRADFRQARGIAGSLLVCKIAGAAAAAGLSLEQVYHEAASAAAAVRTQGVSFNSCTIPGTLPSRPIPPDEMEVGLGIHGEPGLRVKATSSTTAKEVVETIMSQLAAHVPPKVPLCVMLNNLGAVPAMEMAVVAGQVMLSELGSRIKLLIGPAPLMTALDTNGISISVLPLQGGDHEDTHKLENVLNGHADGAKTSRPFSRKPTVHFHTGEELDEDGKDGVPSRLPDDEVEDVSARVSVQDLGLRAERLVAPTTCRGWMPAVVPRSPQIVQRHEANYAHCLRKSLSGALPDSSHPEAASMIKHACKAVLDSEHELNALDAAVADGDLGRNMARAAQTVSKALGDGHLPLAEPGLLFLRLADILRSVDGTLAALLSVFFGRAGRYLEPHRNQKRRRRKAGNRKPSIHLGWEAKVVVRALRSGQKEVETVGEVSEGMRTFLDALAPALRAAEDQLQRKASLYDLIHEDGCGGWDESEGSLSWSLGPSLIADVPGQDMLSSDESLPDNTTEDGEGETISWPIVAAAAQEGARATAGMKAVTGVARAASSAVENLDNVSDPGAMLVALVVTAMAGPDAGMLQVLSEDESIGEHLEIGDTIGRGGFGIVYAAKVIHSGSNVAVKVSKRSKESGPRGFGDLDFLDREIVSNWLFTEKPNITQVHEVLVSPSLLYVVMEYLEGPDFSEWLSSEDGKRRSEVQVVTLLRQVMLAAREVHRHGFVHRDLKFGNFRFASGPQSELKLVDVVGTMCFRPELLASKSWCGTGPFLSPEALLGDVTPASDVWAIGVMAFQLLSGTLPFSASSLVELHEAHGRPIAMEGAPWDVVSPLSKTSVSKLLQTEEAQRPNIQMAIDMVDAEPDGWLAHVQREPAAAAPLPISAPTARRAGGASSEAWTAFAPALKPPEVKTVYLVRHGEAVHNIEEHHAKELAKNEAISAGLQPGSKDFLDVVEDARKKVLEDETLHDASLSPAGKAQALDALAEINKLSMQGFPRPQAIFVSPLQRTLQTAAIIFPDHPSMHVREELRERRTGLPCDDRGSAEDMAMRKTFNFMSFEQLRLHDRRRKPQEAEEPVEKKPELRDRTARVEELLREGEERSLAVVTHKGFLREFERGPLGRATEFGNGEVRVYHVTLPAEGGMFAKLCYSRES
eukprot:TRINITY_DN24782_c0_g1_i1.p1 TRINITY_DN24782_c0_g1~~TRINITY_DN24782_c0_g1_i1.p1  ORF type:complete len:1301 (-),score=272.29 TRINITY_DN24782_c0_g1_i1:47-3949(-)